MNPRQLALLVFASMLVISIWWMKDRVDELAALVEVKITAKGLPEINPVKPAVEAVTAKKGSGAVQPMKGLRGEAAEIMQLLLVRHNVGDYRVALKMAEQAAARTDLGQEFQDWLARQMPVMLVSTAWLEIKQGRCEEAISLLQRAYLVDKSEPVTKGLAFCHYRLRNWVSMEEFAKQYLAQQPTDGEILIIYADALESEQRFKEAAEQLEKAAALNPEDESISTALASMREKIKEGVRQAALASRYIALTYRAGEHEDFADFVITTLDFAVEEFVDRYGFSEPKDPIEVVLYSGENFQSLVSNGPDWAAGIFDGRMRIPIQSSYVSPSGREALRRILRHELVHALLAMQTNFRNVPSWFNEGLAQRLECSSRCQKNLMPPNPGEFLSKEELNQPYTSFPKLKAERSYRQSLYMIITLEHDRDFGSTDNLIRIIERIDGRSDLSSDGLLTPVPGISYFKLHERAARSWSRRVEFKDF